MLVTPLRAMPVKVEKRKVLSKHLSLNEATRSRTATKNGISNQPNDTQLQSLIALADNVFEPLREHVAGPIYVSSAFRSEGLNTRIGGSKTSQHCKGQAIDIDDTYGSATNAMMFQYIYENLDFDQLIWEYGDEKNPDWVHVSYVSEEENRNQTLKVSRATGKAVYSFWKK
jgi:zinc D-Ala-D-Ala carboxypeptidase